VPALIDTVVITEPSGAVIVSESPGFSIFVAPTIQVPRPPVSAETAPVRSTISSAPSSTGRMAARVVTPPSTTVRLPYATVDLLQLRSFSKARRASPHQRGWVATPGRGGRRRVESPRSTLSCQDGAGRDLSPACRGGRHARPPRRNVTRTGVSHTWPVHHLLPSHTGHAWAVTRALPSPGSNGSRRRIERVPR
jgi:hypothetical protein